MLTHPLATVMRADVSTHPRYLCLRLRAYERRLHCMSCRPPHYVGVTDPSIRFSSGDAPLAVEPLETKGRTYARVIARESFASFPSL